MNEKTGITIFATVEKKSNEDVGIADMVASSHENLLSRGKLVIVFMSMAIGLFLSFVDQTGITIALPYIGEELNSRDTISWAGISSLISNTMFMVLFGRFSDIFSRKYVLITCMLVLGVFDIACGFAQTAAQFFVFRAFCGIGAGGITSLSMVIVSDIITLEQRGKFQGILGSFVGLGNICGPFIAAGFIKKHTWRMFYCFLGPVVICSTSIVILLVPYTRPDISIKEKIQNLDYLGFLFSSIAIIFLLIPASGGGSTYEWNSSLVISFFVIGVLSFFCFLYVERKVAVLPMIPMKLFTTRLSLTCLLFQNLFFGMCYFSLIYYYPYYFQIVRGYSALHAAVNLLALVIPQSLTSILTGQVISRTGHYIYVVWFGYISWFISACLLNLWTTSSNKSITIITLVLNGMGIGAIFQPTLVAAQAQSHKRDRATIISTRNVLRSFGGAVGLAISSAIISNVYMKAIKKNGHLHFTTEQLNIIEGNFFGGISLDSYNPAQIEYLREIYLHALKNLFYFWMACMGVCTLSNFAIRDKGLKPLDDQ